MLKPTAHEGDAAKILRNQLGHREVLEYLRRCSQRADHDAIHHPGSDTTSVDVVRGRAQVLRAVVSFLEAKDT